MDSACRSINGTGGPTHWMRAGQSRHRGVSSVGKGSTVRKLSRRWFRRRPRPSRSKHCGQRWTSAGWSCWDSNAGSARVRALGAPQKSQCWRPPAFSAGTPLEMQCTGRRDRLTLTIPSILDCFRSSALLSCSPVCASPLCVLVLALPGVCKRCECKSV